MSLLDVLAWGRRVSGLVYVALLVVAFVGAGVVGIYYRGAHAGAAKVVRVARRDSTAKAVVGRDSAMARTDRSGAVAAHATDAATAGRVSVRASATRVQRRRHDAVVVAALDSTPAPVVQLVEDQAAQIVRDSAQMSLDSLAIAKSAAALDTARQERAAHLAVDTARVHEAQDPTPDNGRSALDVAKDVSLVAVVIGAVVAVLSLFHR